MTIAVLADEPMKKEWLSKAVPDTIEYAWADSVKTLSMFDADLYVDLLFDNDPERNEHLKPLNGKPLLVNAVTWRTKDIGHPFIRINGWPTLLGRPVLEIALPDPSYEAVIRPLFEQLGWQYRLAPDVPGMITARVLAMIINEAYFTFEAGVSTPEGIDIAMRLGTNYPKGPFEWGTAIGLHRVYELLKTLSETDPRYSAAPSLQSAVAAQQ